MGYNTIEQDWFESWSGSGTDTLAVKFSEWFTYTGPRTLTITVTSELGEKVLTVTQTNESPWISFNASSNKIAHTGGSIIFNDYNAVTNCKNVTLTVSAGTITPSTHTGK